MGLDQLLKEPDLSILQEGLKRVFFDATGYGSDDLLAYNFGTRKFLTRNSGKYQVAADGTIIHLSGPPPDVSDRYLD